MASKKSSSDKLREVEIEVFGHRFKTLPGLAEDLITLEKEGAIYSHFWDESSQTFKYYRIRLLPKEIFEYTEAHVAKQQFDDAIEKGANFEKALKAITNPMIRERVNSYGDYGNSRLKNGLVVDIRGCAASFYPPEMEALVCGQRPDRYELLPKLNEIDKTNLAIKVIDNFRVSAHSLRTRGHGRPAFLIENEYDVQDLLFACVRSVFDDARREEWTPKHAGGAKRIDIVLPSAGVLVETKFVRTSAHANSLANEIKIDLESYHSHPACKTILVMIYDPQSLIVDPDVLSRDLSGHRTKGSSAFDVQVMVRR